MWSRFAASLRMASRRFSHCPTHVVLAGVRVGRLLHALPDALVDDRRLAGAARAHQHQRPAVGARQPPRQLLNLALAVHDAVQLVGVEPVEASADLLQLFPARHRFGVAEELERQARFALGQPRAGVHVDVDGGEPRARAIAEHLRDVQLRVLLLQPQQVVEQHFACAGNDVLPARDLEPQPLHVGEEAISLASRLERQRHQRHLRRLPAQGQRPADAMLGKVRRERPPRQLVLPRRAGQPVQQLAQVLGELRHRAAEDLAVARGLIEEDRPHGEDRRGRVLLLALLDVERDGEVHGSTCSRTANQSRCSIASRRASLNRRPDQRSSLTSS